MLTDQKILDSIDYQKGEKGSWDWGKGKKE
jgi:hypothetical protein